MFSEGTASDFADALGSAIRENPVSAALIGMGVLWMFLGGSNTTLFGGTGRKSIFRTAARGAAEAAGVVRDTAGHVGSSVSSAAEQVANTAAGTISGMADAVRRSSAAAGDVASRTAAQARDAVSAGYEAGTDVASRAGETLSNATTSAASALQERGSKLGSTLQQNLADMFERQPLLLGAVGLAIGAGIAASIPATEAEKQVMGKASDAVRGAVGEKVEQAKEMVGAAVDEAKAQGLAPKMAAQTERAMTGKK
jgi:hypothetical protein